MNYPRKFTTFLACGLGAVLSAQGQSTTINSGSWDDPAVWEGGNVPSPETSFIIAADHTVTAEGLGIIQDNNSVASIVYGTLSIGEGASLTTSRLNRDVDGGTFNIDGGELTINRFWDSSGFTINVNAGRMRTLEDHSFVAQGYTININGGTLETESRSFRGTDSSIHINGGKLIMRAGANDIATLRSGSWTTGTVAVAGVMDGRLVSLLWASHPENILEVSLNNHADQLTTSSQHNLSSNQGILRFNIYSANANDNDKLVANAGATFSFGSGVELQIGGNDLPGSIQDYMGVSYKFFEVENYSNITPTVADSTITISGKEYHVTWQDNLAVDGTLTLNFEPVAVTGVTISPASVELESGETAPFSATIEPEDATDQRLVWSSSDTDVFTVDQDGVVTGVGDGVATLTVTTMDGDHTDTASVSVTFVLVSVTGVTVAPTSNTIEVGDSRQLVAVVSPVNASNKDVTWTSSDTDVVTVDDEGRITGVSVGSATITVTTEDGNFTAQSAVSVVEDVPLPPGVSRNAGGWTIVTPSEDSRVVYVSSSEGDDANDGLSPETPKKTIRAGNDLLRHGYPDHLLLKRGDVFPAEANNILGNWKDGRSAQEPILLSYYGDSGPRPVVKVTNSLIDHNGQTRNYQAIIGIDIYKSNSDPDSPDFTNASGGSALRFVGGGDNLLIEDCRLRFIMITLQSYESAVYRNPTLRRNIVLDAWGHGSYLGHDGRIQGIFISGVEEGYLLEENFFDHNGWSRHGIENAGPNMYNHNVYIQYSNVEGGIIRGNIISRGSAHGIQARSGGVVERNLFVLNAISLNMGGHGAPTHPGVYEFDNRATQNVAINGRMMDPDNSSDPRTPAVWAFTAAYFHTTYADNIVAHAIHDGSNAAFPTDSGGSRTLIDNIVWKWDPGDDTTNPGWTDPDADLGDYFESIGGANDTIAYLNWLRDRPVGTMPWEMTAYAAINYIREGFDKDPVDGYYAYDGDFEFVPVTGVGIEPTSVTLLEGESISLSVTVTPGNASYPAVAWSSSDESVATVTAQGLVYATGIGVATITATTEDGGFTAATAVKVEAPPSWAGFPLVDGWAFTGDKYLGWLYIHENGWVYSDSVADWLYINELDVYSGGLWAYFPAFPTVSHDNEAPWVALNVLQTWCYVMDYQANIQNGWAYIFDSGQ